MRAPVAIDVREGVWGVEDDAPFDAMISLNMVHIAPWEAALGLLAGGKRLLRPDGLLFLYGPFMIGGKHTATTNAAFNADLKHRDPRWGVRDVDESSARRCPTGSNCARSWTCRRTTSHSCSSSRARQTQLEFVAPRSASLAHCPLPKKKALRSSRVWPTLPAQKLSRRPWRTKIF